MKIIKYIGSLLLLLAVNSSFAQAPVDQRQLLKDVNGGDVVFTTIAANDATLTWGQGYGVNNKAFIKALRDRTIAVLPITLSSLKSVKEASAVNIVWKTSSERNSDYFEVLKSTDGKIFSSIGVVRASGTSNQNITYSFKDVNPVKGTNYYQLNMIDLDGSSKESIIVSASFDLDKADFDVVTDASKGMLLLNVYSNKTKPAVFEVYDVAGNKLLNRSLNLQNGSNSFEFRILTASKIIVVQLSSEGDKQTKKFFY